ncbi:MAG: LptA/OstA family protein [Terrimicrobiaceae bacterium]|nr:LptA/OstA family protein [Terrimicrobiaceae bacterium]
MRPLRVLAIASLFTLSAIAQDESPSMSPGERSSAPLGGAFAGLGKDRPKDARTEITATKEASFDNATSTAEFIGRVVVRDPQFTLTCDRLKVVLSKDRRGMETAEAFGNVVIVQENTDGSGETTKAIGRAGEATYVPASGDVTLRVWPSIQQGVNNQVATEEGTVMILNRSGRSTTKGGSKTMITDTGA